MILRIGSGEIAFIVSADAPAVSSPIAVVPEGLNHPVAPTLLLAGQNAAAAASLAAQGAAVYTASEDAGLCIASRGDNFMIRRS